MSIIIVLWLGSDRLSGLFFRACLTFFRACLTFFHTRASLLIFFVCFIILFHSCCSPARLFGKTLLHVQLQVDHENPVRYGGNADALVNPNTKLSFSFSFLVLV